ncbi:hypothetical protein KFE25_007704 [Diacronema lutheri]|uniref:4-hydroxyphenylpyruvate dioxygenase n=1 Tax=Diacronema lutheri TaxID=2081491 RepID=A0A8J5XUF4_DIALT|nr:hypothetical protein KFE25_007704 [Diacronema lutheri]
MAKLVGYANFKRSNPMTDRFDMRAFHHVEFLCGDAQTTAARWSYALGMPLVARSDLSTGNTRFASHVIGSGSIRFVFTAPTSSSDALDDAHPSVTTTPRAMREYVARHGLSAVAVAIHVEDAREAFERAVAGGAKPAMPPRTTPADGGCVVSEVLLHADGDALLRFVSGASADGATGFLPGYAPTGAALDETYGFVRLDHVVSNVAQLLPAVDYLIKAVGLHQFAEFTAEDVGTPFSGLNSMVLASNNESVLLPLNEPTTGSARKSQIQTYLEQHDGPGVQHIAIKTDDIFATAELCDELGILADRDDQGVLLQIFTKPIGDRATLFLEVIQRIGCDEGGAVEQKGGCGGFGKGNFHELFRAIEELETRAGINTAASPPRPSAGA